MEIEKLEIRDFMLSCPPLDRLDDKVLTKIVNAIEITYLREGKVLLEPGKANKTLYLIRSGAVEVSDPEGHLHGRYGSKEWVGYKSVMRDGVVTMQVKVIEDSLLYMIPSSMFLQLLESYPFINEFFSQEKPERLRSAMVTMRDTANTTLISTRVIELIHGTPLQIDANLSISDAARKMRDAIVTAMLITEGDNIKGIITDRAFCTKAVANELDLNLPISQIMTPNPITVEADTLGSEALIIMAKLNIRHLPVVQNGKLCGMITATDLIRRQSLNPIYLINEIYRATELAELVTLSQQLPGTLVTLVDQHLSAQDIGHALSAIGKAITRRLLVMGERLMGPPPVPYLWVAAGSLARGEQTLHTDQDNALILSDDFIPEQHDEYFLKLCRFVSDGLNACHYVYCPGNVMATNVEWRQPLSVWKEYFHKWITVPQPKSLMYSSIFFDLLALHGETDLLKELQNHISELSQKNTVFLHYMAANALQYTPPLGLFRSFVLEKGGAETKVLDMKKRGVTPVIDLARIYALASGATLINTQDRLNSVAEAGVLSQDGKNDLSDAFEFISTVRLRHQARQIAQGNTDSDNYVPPEELSSLERRHLKDAFEVVRTLQAAMAQSYQTELLG